MRSQELQARNLTPKKYGVVPFSGKPNRFQSTPLVPLERHLNPTHGRVLDSLRLITRELPAKITIARGPTSEKLFFEEFWNPNGIDCFG